MYATRGYKCIKALFLFVVGWAEKRHYYTSRAARLDTYRAGESVGMKCSVLVCNVYSVF